MAYDQKWEDFKKQHSGRDWGVYDRIPSKDDIGSFSDIQNPGSGTLYGKRKSKPKSLPPLKEKEPYKIIYGEKRPYSGNLYNPNLYSTRTAGETTAPRAMNKKEKRALTMSLLGNRLSGRGKTMSEHQLDNISFYKIIDSIIRNWQNRSGPLRHLPQKEGYSIRKRIPKWYEMGGQIQSI